VDLVGQKLGKVEADPLVPEVFKNEKTGNTKVDEGKSGEGGRPSEGDDKPFCFRCYKPGYGKLVCTTRLRCEICGGNEHMTGKCHILKQPRFVSSSLWLRYEWDGVLSYTACVDQSREK
jgi:hypothetical protein